MFFFVPETFWDRTPRPHVKRPKSTFRTISGLFHPPHQEKKSEDAVGGDALVEPDRISPAITVRTDPTAALTIAERRQRKHTHHVGFADDVADIDGTAATVEGENQTESSQKPQRLDLNRAETAGSSADQYRKPTPYPGPLPDPSPSELMEEAEIEHKEPTSAMTDPATAGLGEHPPTPAAQRYTTYLRTQPPKTFLQSLKPWNGRLRHDNWFLVALRPFILFAYPAILWSSLVYSLSVGWLIVLSESVSEIYRVKDYNFSALGVGLVYISPFIGGILGTAVAGKVSDIIVKAMSRRNGGVYEPEFRLVMALPVAISTCIGLMGFGWSAEEKNLWIVPTIFFGVISFGSSLGSTTAITFA
ncbi:MAG: hypothetical protein LQ341_004645, partial [Variospora aurantia]